MSYIPFHMRRYTLSLALGLSLLGHASAVLSLLPYGNRMKIGREGGAIEVELAPTAQEHRHPKHQHQRLLTQSPELPLQGENEAVPQEAMSDGGQGVLGESEVDAPVKLLSEPRPRYPRNEYRNGIESDVVLYLVVDEKGRVVQAEITRSGGESFDQSALEAARRLEFTPATKDGRSVMVHVHWTCRFRIQD